MGGGVRKPRKPPLDPPLLSTAHTRGHLSVDFRDKLWGSKEELQTTAQFSKNIDLPKFDMTIPAFERRRRRRRNSLPDSVVIAGGVNTFKSRFNISWNDSTNYV